MTPQRTKLRPRELARMWGVATDKILGFIHRGELRAMNVASRRNGKPRWLVDLADIVVFEQSRTATPAQPPTGRKRTDAPNVIQFF